MRALGPRMSNMTLALPLPAAAACSFLSCAVMYFTSTFLAPCTPSHETSFQVKTLTFIQPELSSLLTGPSATFAALATSFFFFASLALCRFFWL